MENDSHEAAKKLLLRHLQKVVKRFLKFYITFSTNNTQTTYYDSASPVAKDLLLELKKCMEYGATEDVPGQENSARLPFVWGVLQDVQSECEVNSEVNPRLKSAISEIVSSQILQLGGMMEKWHACTAVFFDRGVLLPALSRILENSARLAHYYHAWALMRCSERAEVIPSILGSLASLQLQPNADTIADMDTTSVRWLEVRGAGISTINGIFRRSGDKAGCAWFEKENDNGVYEIFRYQTKKSCPQWYLGMPKKKKVFYYRNCNSPHSRKSPLPPYTNWLPFDSASGSAPMLCCHTTPPGSAVDTTPPSSAVEPNADAASTSSPGTQVVVESSELAHVEDSGSIRAAVANRHDKTDANTTTISTDGNTDSVVTSHDYDPANKTSADIDTNTTTTTTTTTTAATTTETATTENNNSNNELSSAALIDSVASTNGASVIATAQPMSSRDTEIVVTAKDGPNRHEEFMQRRKSLQQQIRELQRQLQDVEANKPVDVWEAVEDFIAKQSGGTGRLPSYGQTKQMVLNKFGRGVFGECKQRIQAYLITAMKEAATPEKTCSHISLAALDNDFVSVRRSMLQRIQNLQQDAQAKTDSRPKPPSPPPPTSICEIKPKVVLRTVAVVRGATCDRSMDLFTPKLVQYTIQCTAANRKPSSWSVTHRFTRFLALQNLLLAEFPDLKSKLPSLPSTGPFAHANDFQSINERKQQLDRYIKNLVAMGSPISGSQALSEFLSTDPRVAVRPTDGQGLMRNHLDSGRRFSSKLTVKQHLSIQDNICPLCKKFLPNPTAFVPTKFRFCHYSFRYHCKMCQGTNQVAVVPARVVLHWDFIKYTVTPQAKEALQDLEDNPIINLHSENPKLFDKVPALHRIRKQRLKLHIMDQFIQNCPQKEKLMKLFQGKSHLMETTELYSMIDLAEVHNGTMEKFLKKLLHRLETHITQQCNRCKHYAFLCEICKSRNPIYSFQIETVQQCKSCFTCFHRNCWNSVDECPKCIRLRNRDLRLTRS